MQAPPTFYFSLRSPYSWLAWHDLKANYPKLLARLRLAPFWEPDADYQAELGQVGESFLYAAMSKDKHLYILSDVKRLAGRRGLQPHWPVDRAPRWEVPHLAYLRAEALGQGAAFIDLAIQARWQQGRDICDPEVIALIATQLGLDSASLRDAHRDPELRRQGLQCLRSCVRDGVFGVPFFVTSRERFWGLDRLPEFIGALAQATLVHTTPDVATGCPSPALLDHAGGCG